MNQNIKILTYEEFLNEGLFLDKFKNIYDKIISELKTDFKFITTFGTGVTLLFPIVENLLKNYVLKIDLNPTNIILITICGVSIIVNESKEKIELIKEKILDGELLKYLKDIVMSLQKIKELFSYILELSGKTVRNFIDLLSYTSIFVPFINALLNFIKTNQINIQDLKSLVLGGGISVGLIAGKNIVEYLLKELRINGKS